MEHNPISCDENGIALDGYDMVAYFTDGKPCKGDPQWSSNYCEAIWYFASEKNKQLFDSDPEKYMPEFGGYCAYAVANGKDVKSAGKQGAIIDGKLYFSLNMMIKTKYLLNPAKYNQDAEQKWEMVKQDILTKND